MEMYGFVLATFSNTLVSFDLLIYTPATLLFMGCWDVVFSAGTGWETRETKLPRWQHGNVSASLSSLDTCPFAVSMRAAHRVLVLTDHSADTLERCWVVFEAALAHELGKVERVGDSLGKGEWRGYMKSWFCYYLNDFVRLMYIYI